MVDEGDTLVFGYGSLVWHTGPIVFTAHWDGFVSGFERRFYQGSPDHRGTPEAPGRVVTLLPSFDRRGAVWGKVYAIPRAHRDEALRYLGHREIAGYIEMKLPVSCHDGVVRHALVYLATPDNDHYLGKASGEEIARCIASRVGPSGRNLDYFSNLVLALRQMSERTGWACVDDHLLEIESALASLGVQDVIEESED